MSETAPPPPEAVVTQMIFGKWVAMALSVAAKLRVADALAAGPKSVADLAAETGTHAAEPVPRAAGAGERRRVRRGRGRPVPPDAAVRGPAVRRAGVDAGRGRLLRGGLELAAVGAAARDRPHRQDRVRRGVRGAGVRVPRQAPGRVGGVQRGDDRVLDAGVAGRRGGLRLLAVRHDRRRGRRARPPALHHPEEVPRPEGRRVRRRRTSPTARRRGSPRPGWPTGAGPRAATSSGPSRPATPT